MPKPASFHDHYKQGVTPWETNRVDKSLVDFVEKSGLKPCSVLDAGCGTGNNAIWLAKQDFTVTGWDFVAQAINSAKGNAKKAGTICSFSQIDIMELSPNIGPFDFIFDRGLFHCFKSSNQLHEIAGIMASLLPANGIWLSLIGNADETRSAQGPPQMSASQISEVVEPLFIIDSLTASFFDSDQKTPAKNWVCQMRKR